MCCDDAVKKTMCAVVLLGVKKLRWIGTREMQCLPVQAAISVGRAGRGGEMMDGCVGSAPLRSSRGPRRRGWRPAAWVGPGARTRRARIARGQTWTLHPPAEWGKEGGGNREVASETCCTFSSCGHAGHREEEQNEKGTVVSREGGERLIAKGPPIRTASSRTVAPSSSTPATVPARHFPPRPSLVSKEPLLKTSTARPGR